MFYKRKSSYCPTPGVGEYDLDKSVESINGKSPRAPIGNAKRFKLPGNNPGVGDYDLATSIEQTKKTSPRATIGSDRRFIEPEVNRYKSSTPCEYATRQPIRPKLGTIGNAKRFVYPKKEDLPPGVGKYDVGQYKCMHKASETQFHFNLQNLPQLSSRNERRADS